LKHTHQGTRIPIHISDVRNRDLRCKWAIRSHRKDPDRRARQAPHTRLEHLWIHHQCRRSRCRHRRGAGLVRPGRQLRNSWGRVRWAKSCLARARWSYFKERGSRSRLAKPSGDRPGCHPGVWNAVQRSAPRAGSLRRAHIARPPRHPDADGGRVHDLRAGDGGDGPHRAGSDQEVDLVRRVGEAPARSCCPSLPVRAVAACETGAIPALSLCSATQR
jgi:hypothetical protein